MEADKNTCVTDLVDTVHHEMDSIVHSHHFYKSVITSNRTTRLREGACWPMHTMNVRYMAVTKDSNSWPHSVGNLFTPQVVLYYMKGLCRPLSSVCHITGTRKKGKGLEVSCKVPSGIVYLINIEVNIIYYC